MLLFILKEKKKIEYLLLHYSKGHWGFPKGKIEKGETKQQAALRELKEEAGLKASLDPSFEHLFEYFFKDKDGQLVKKKVYFFVGKSITKQATLSHEHVDFVWLEFDQAYEKLTYKNAKQMLKKVHKFLMRG